MFRTRIRADFVPFLRVRRLCDFCTDQQTMLEPNAACSQMSPMQLGGLVSSAHNFRQAYARAMQICSFRFQPFPYPGLETVH